MSFILIVPLLAIGIGLIVGLFATRNRSSLHQESRPNRDALQILDERFARGEIDEAEYIRKKTVLKR